MSYRHYVGTRANGRPAVYRIEDDWRKTRLNPRHDLMNHSPDGFEWGYDGSGPAQLALAIVADATGDDTIALQTYQRFKREIVAHFGDEWILEAGYVAAFARTLLMKDPA